MNTQLKSHDHHHHDLSEAGPSDGPGPDSDEDIALRYAQRMFERQTVPLPPSGFTVDWSDRPSKHTWYLDTPRLPLPPGLPALPSVTVDAAVSAAVRSPSDALPDLTTIASALGTYGVTGRRVDANWNDDSSVKLRSHEAIWSRPTPSGGGMYPVESYLVVGDRGPLPIGVYHYASAHHGLDRLAVHNRCADLARATGVDAGLYLVAAVRFWKNSFKYNSFCYHVVTQDTGAALASWRMAFGASGLAVQPVFWFDEDVVSAAVDIDGETEAPFVVVPLGPRATTGNATTGNATEVPTTARPVSRATHRVWERSARVRTFPMVEQVHAAALVGAKPRPDATAATAGTLRPPAAHTDPVVLPAADSAGLDLAVSLGRRRSTFGVFSGAPSLTVEDLGSVLGSVAGIGTAGTDVAPSPRRSPWIRAWVMANHVDGLDQRGYAYEPDGHRLVPGAPVDFAELQRHYMLTNYNVREAAALIVFTGRLEPLVRAYGARGYRMLSIEVGQAVQALYLAATSRGLGTGAVLGVDNVAVDAMLGLTGTDEQSMLFALIGPERGPRADYDHTVRHPASYRDAAGTAQGSR